MFRPTALDRPVLRVVDLQRTLRFHVDALACTLERRCGAQGAGPSMYLADPEGNVVELKGPPDDAA